MILKRTNLPSTSNVSAACRTFAGPVTCAVLCILGAGCNSGGGTASAETTEQVLVEPDSAVTYLVNTGAPGVGLAWTDTTFDDSAWARGQFGIGYEQASGAEELLETNVPLGAASVYIRSTFEVETEPAENDVFLGLDYDDGVVAWINGIEVYRTPEMPDGTPLWDTRAADRESSNSVQPDFSRMLDITTTARPALRQGINVLALGVWNASVDSSDLVVVPKLSLRPVPRLTRGPYLQQGTPESLVIRWRTDAPASSVVRYGATPQDLDQSTTSADPLVLDHSVRLEGLAPDTLYYYSIETATRRLAGGDDEHYFVSAPLTGTVRPTRIWVLGDSGTADENAASVRDAYYRLAEDEHTDVWLMLGDNAYPDGTDNQYQAALFDMFPELLRTVSVWPTMGNHDAKSAVSATQTGVYYEIFTLPTQGEAGGLASGTEAYYSFDFANIHFICLDSHGTDRSRGGAMMAWLMEDLADNTQEWVIAFWHHPPYSKGSHDSDAETRLIEMREVAIPILEDGGVDLVLSGHSHSYERSYLIDGHYGHSSTFVEAMKKDSGDGRSDGDGSYEKPSVGPFPHEGAVYIVAGSSGLLSSGPLDHPVMYHGEVSLGSLVFDVEGSRLDARFIEPGGTVRDYFTIVKGAGLEGVGGESRSEP